MVYVCAIGFYDHLHFTILILILKIYSGVK